MSTRLASAVASTPPRRPSPGVAAFTLVELLVVIGIIALLISILLPTLNTARAKSQEVVCSSNIRQIGVAMVFYANEQGGRLPASYLSGQAYDLNRDGTLDAGEQSFDVYWHQRLMIDEFIPGFNEPDRSVAICPSDASQWQPFTFPGEENLFNSSFGINNFFSMYDGAAWSAGGTTLDGIDDTNGTKWEKLSSIKSSPTKIVVADNKEGILLDTYSPNTDAPGADFNELDWYRHGKVNDTGVKGGKVNALFVDGHVISMDQGQDVVDQVNPINGLLTSWGADVYGQAELQWSVLAN